MESVAQHLAFMSILLATGREIGAETYELDNVDGLVQDCSNSIANALELLQSCTKPSVCFYLMISVLVQILNTNCVGICNMYLYVWYMVVPIKYPSFQIFLCCLYKK